MPAHRVVAHNWATKSENKIHDDEVARRLGFGGGLVPGVALFAYLVRPAVESLGESWLAGGTMSARFLSPVYEGENVLADAAPISDGISLALTNGSGLLTSTGSATSNTVGRYDLDDYPEAVPPAGSSRPSANEDSLAPGTVLGSLTAGFRADRAPEYLDQIRDDLPLWRSGVAHPGWLLLFANLILTSNVRLGPWIHVQSDIDLHRRVVDGDVVTTRGRVARLFERKGHRFVELDLVLAVGDEVAWHITHTAIYQVRLADGTE